MKLFGVFVLCFLLLVSVDVNKMHAADDGGDFLLSLIPTITKPTYLDVNLVPEDPLLFNFINSKGEFLSVTGTKNDSGVAQSFDGAMFISDDGNSILEIKNDSVGNLKSFNLLGEGNVDLQYMSSSKVIVTVTLRDGTSEAITIDLPQGTSNFLQEQRARQANTEASGVCEALGVPETYYKPYNGTINLYCTDRYVNLKPPVITILNRDIDSSSPYSTRKFIPKQCPVNDKLEYTYYLERPVVHFDLWRTACLCNQIMLIPLMKDVAAARLMLWEDIIINASKMGVSYLVTNFLLECSKKTAISLALVISAVKALERGFCTKSVYDIKMQQLLGKSDVSGKFDDQHVIVQNWDPKITPRLPDLDFNAKIENIAPKEVGPCSNMDVTLLVTGKGLCTGQLDLGNFSIPQVSCNSNGRRATYSIPSSFIVDHPNSNVALTYIMPRGPHSNYYNLKIGSNLLYNYDISITHSAYETIVINPGPTDYDYWEYETHFVTEPFRLQISPCPNSYESLFEFASFDHYFLHAQHGPGYNWTYQGYGRNSTGGMYMEFNTVSRNNFKLSVGSTFTMEGTICPDGEPCFEYSEPSSRQWDIPEKPNWAQFPIDKLGYSFSVPIGLHSVVNFDIIAP